MIKFLLQKLADYIIEMIKISKTEKDLELIFSFGLKLDYFAIRNFKIYLD